MDLAEGHVAALDKLQANPDIGCMPYNLGTGMGSTVLEMVKASPGALHFGDIPLPLFEGTSHTDPLFPC